MCVCVSMHAYAYIHADYGYRPISIHMMFFWYAHISCRSTLLICFDIPNSSSCVKCMLQWCFGMALRMLGQDGVGWETFFQDLLGLPMLLCPEIPEIYDTPQFCKHPVSRSSNNCEFSIKLVVHDQRPSSSHSGWTMDRLLTCSSPSFLLWML